jgi:hypothetical protein
MSRPLEYGQNDWTNYSRSLGEMPEGDTFGPDFIVISPAKSGTTWMLENILRHPDVSIHRNELQYFCTFWRWLDIGWYLDQFEKSFGRRKGYFGQSYALLPEFAIKKLHSLFPDLKIIYILRNPMARTWSHIKMDASFGNGGFAGGWSMLGALRLEDYFSQCRLDYYIAFSNHAANLARWSSVFPAENIHVDFLDNAENNPREFLGNVFEFLEIEEEIEYASLPLEQRINSGIELETPHDLYLLLRNLFSKTADSLNARLKESHGLSLPEAWGLGGYDDDAIPPGIDMEPDDKRLTDLLDWQMKNAHLGKLIEGNYRGYNILFYFGSFHALACRLGPMDFRKCDSATLADFSAQGAYFHHASFHGAKRLVDAYLSGERDTVAPR